MTKTRYTAADGSFITKKENILITGSTGRSLQLASAIGPVLSAGL
ncbi:MAG: hypothetical protein U0T75_06850 [Chitinophagales bacterium]